MKRFFISALCLVSLTWACQKEEDKVTPTVQKAATLSAEEQLVADRMGSTIAFSEFQSMTAAYKASVSSEDTRAVAYGKTVIEKILAQKGCVGIRFYFAKDKSGKTTMVFIGVDKNGNDITPAANARTKGDDSSAGGSGPTCPKQC